MVRRYSTRSRPATGSAAEPTLGPRPPAADPLPQLSDRIDTIVATIREPGRTVLVSGGLSAGKSAACEEIADQLASEVPVLRVSATQSDNAYTDLLATILEFYGFEIRQSADAQALTELVAHEARDALNPERRCVIVLDDAHALPLGDLEALCGLIPESALSLALTGPDSLATLLKRLAELQGADLTVVPLDQDPVIEEPAVPLAADPASSPRNSRYRTEQARAGSQKAESARSSTRGSGSRIDDWLERLTLAMTKRRQAPTEPSAESSAPVAALPRLPTRHLVTLGLVLLVMLGAWIAARFAEESAIGAGSRDRVVELPMPPIGSEPSGAANNADAVSGVAADPAPALPGQDAGPALTSGDTASTRSGNDTLPESAESATTPAPRPIISRQSAATSTPQTTAGTGAPPKSTPEPTPTPPTSTTRAAAPQTAAAPNPTPAAAANPKPAPAPMTTPAPAQPQVARAPVTPRPAASVAASGARDATWILGQPAARYTLQLVSLSSPTRAREFIDLQSDKSRFATYRLQRNGQLFHVVIYGSFASKAEADTAAARLPPSAGGVQPWIRTFGQVQESVRSTAQ